MHIRIFGLAIPAEAYAATVREYEVLDAATAVTAPTPVPVPRRPAVVEDVP